MSLLPGTLRFAGIPTPVQFPRSAISCTLRISLGTAITGEHGIGLGKLNWLRKEHGEGVDWMVAIKRTFDPDNLLNPRKVVALEA